MLSRRAALRGGTGALAAITAAGAATYAAAETTPDPLREGVQALVNEIRGPVLEGTRLGSYCALQEMADLLELLPGIEPVRNDAWEDTWKPLIGSDDIRGLEWQFTGLYKSSGRAEA